MEQRRLLMGDIVGLFGVQGQLKLRSHTDPPEQIGRYRPWYLRLRGVEHRIDRPQCRRHGKGVLLTLPGVNDRNQAEAWLGAEIWIERSALPALPPGQYYWSDLEGIRVETVDGRVLGRVSHLLATGANDVIVVHGERERLIPFLQPDVVREIDLAAGLMRVDWDPEF